MGKPWFDPETGVLMLDEYITSLPSYEKYVADGIITPTEVAEQAQNLAKSLQKLEQSLSPEQHALATEALCETAFLYEMMSYN
jgi:hypothetical protein